ncbi:MAG: hypothetical protein CVU05_06315 [Bacteroidetes bacterium HGW-Bacteroidetes-21]|jgi:hypothetical protein|nr:MAG: hypothetical protein CVU05_06315 [Bacteroidetes bacterium HGW-Bacteroidetes-21]
MINISESFSTDIINVWNKYKDIYFAKNSPLTPISVVSKDLLFIGLNPSIRKNINIEEIKYKGVMDTYKVSHCNDKYFGKFYTISEGVGKTNNWTHFDLLFYRGSQAEVINVIKDDENNGCSFIYEQLMISKKILEGLNPKIIVICNKLAAELTGYNKTKDKNGNEIRKWMDLPFEIGETSQTLNGIPVIIAKQINRFYKDAELQRLIETIKHQ